MTQQSHNPTPQVALSVCFQIHCNMEGIKWRSYVKRRFCLFVFIYHIKKIYENVKSNIMTVLVFYFIQIFIL